MNLNNMWSSIVCCAVVLSSVTAYPAVYQQRDAEMVLYRPMRMPFYFCMPQCIRTIPSMLQVPQIRTYIIRICVPESKDTKNNTTAVEIPKTTPAPPTISPKEETVSIREVIEELPIQTETANDPSLEDSRVAEEESRNQIMAQDDENINASLTDNEI